MRSIRYITSCIFKNQALAWVMLPGIAVCALAASAHAQHSVDIQKLAADGEHMKALAMYELLPARNLSLSARIAAAKSAWALGLNRQAAEAFDSILREAQLPQDTRARLTLSRGVLEYQEEKYAEAALFAEKTVSYLQQSSPLRSRALLLWGQSLTRVSAYASAQEKLAAALEDSSPADQPEIQYSLGVVETKLGKYSEAEKHLKAIPTDHERAAATVRLLATLSLETHQPDRARFWIEKGKSDYPDAFLDSWGDYGLLQIALEKGEVSRARNTFESAQKQYAPSDPWLVLMQAALEQAEWKKEPQGGTLP